MPKEEFLPFDLLAVLIRASKSSKRTRQSCRFISTGRVGDIVDLITG